MSSPPGARLWDDVAPPTATQPATSAPEQGATAGDMLTVGVIGAGIVGASIACRLAQQGARVRILDAAQPGSGTTSSSFAWVNANQKTPRDYFDLNHAGLEEHVRLPDELQPAIWFHAGGNLIWAETTVDRDELEARVERLRGWGYAAEWWSAAQVNAELEPAVAFPTPETAVAFFPDEAWVDAPQLTGRLVAVARRHGAEVGVGTAVEAIETAGGRVAAIRLRGSARIPVDAVVSAAGPGAERIAALLGLPLPLAPTRGLLVRLAVEGDPVRRVVHSPRVNARPDGRGHLIIHHDLLDRQLRDRHGIHPADPPCDALLRRAREVIPALEAAIVVTARIGVRPIPRDGRACVGAVSAVPGYYEAVTHSGVTLGPLIGRLLAREMLSGEVDPLLAPFRPDRFPRG